ncbi:MAG: D-alanyl-D-alanine carboxypeptidase/D-alanyl-D-alanine-endopeptidase [Demequinaceae bacterium]|nr:D-alanyl-D-alanine carboxypeptidase/D-alanyl-D-alanine-endopeptidase [Demequinaceae bacterium]
MARTSVVVASTGAIFLTLAGGYAVADASDVVPGWITDDPLKPLPPPFPESVAPEALQPESPVASLDFAAPIPSSAVIQRLADSLNADSRVGNGSNLGLIVVDIATGQVLAEIRADDPQIPASNVKILTAAAVEYSIPPDLRLVTSVTWSGATDGEQARLTLTAGGDMLLVAGYGHKGTEGSPNGYAGVADLADRVVAALESTTITAVDLVVDDHAFGGPSIPESWTWDNVTEGYASPVSGLAINLGLIPGTEDDPERYLDPGMQVGEVLAGRLEERGIAVDSMTRGVAAQGEVELASVESASISDVVAYTLWYSVNTIAEDLVKVVALEGGRKGTTEVGLAEVRRLLTAKGLDMNGVVLADGSGLSRKNRLTPRVVADLIVLLARDPDHASLLEEYPIAALRGTLYDRFRSTEGAGVVRGKTGSLSGVTSLSGTVVTADGRWLAYSILADGLPWGQTRPQAAIDEVLSAVAACGCG